MRSKKPSEAKEPHLHWKKEGSKDTEFESVPFTVAIGGDTLYNCQFWEEYF